MKYVQKRLGHKNIHVIQIFIPMFLNKIDLPTEIEKASMSTTPRLLTLNTFSNIDLFPKDEPVF